MPGEDLTAAIDAMNDISGAGGEDAGSDTSMEFTPEVPTEPDPKKEEPKVAVEPSVPVEVDKAKETPIEPKAEPTDPLEILRLENEELRKNLNEMTKVKQEESAKKVEPVTMAKVALDDLIIDDDHLETILSNKASLLDFLDKFASKVQQATSEHILKSVPDVVKHNVSLQVELQNRAAKFYSESPDLANFKPAVASTMSQLAAANPDWDLDKVFAETETATRKILKLAKQTIQAPVVGKPPAKSYPRTPNGGRIPNNKPETSKLLADIDAMNAID